MSEDNVINKAAHLDDFIIDNNNDDDDDDILSDVRNLFINSEDDDNEVNEQQVPAEVKPIFVAEEEKPKQSPAQTIFDSTLHKGPLPGSKPATSPPPAGKVIAELKPKGGKGQSPPPQQSSGKCKSNADCNADSFCITKTGKCVAKLIVGQAGCSADDQCQGKTTACYSKTCKQLCNTQSETIGCGTGNECVETKGLKALKAFDGLFNGVCDKAKQGKGEKNPEITSDRVMANTSKSSMAIVGSAVILLLIGLTVLFVYIRGYLKRRFRNNNPDMFLFNKLQKNTSQALAGGQQPLASGDRLNSRLSSVGGARFTRWAVLSNENRNQQNTEQKQFTCDISDDERLPYMVMPTIVPLVVFQVRARAIMARSTSALHRMADSENAVVSDNNQSTPSPKQLHSRRLSTSTTKTLLSDAEMAFDSDSSISSISSVTGRRSRKTWTEAEEACLISGYAKHQEDWEAILNDKEYSFNNRIAKDLRTKYRALIKTDLNMPIAASAPVPGETTIFDIRTVNEKVTEVFIGPDWSRAQWLSSELVEPPARLQELLADFEKKIAAKQKMISRISPARTPSRFLSSLAINSAVKRRQNESDASSQDEMIGTPLKKSRGIANNNNEVLTASPLSVRSVKSNKSTKSSKSVKSSKSNTQEVLLVHSDSEENVVFPDEAGEPTSEKKSLVNRCIIM